MWAGWTFVKLAGLNVITETGQEAYLPVKPAQAMSFKLKVTVKFA